MAATSVRKGIGAGRLFLVGLFLWTSLGGSAFVQAQNRVGRPGLLDPMRANPLLQLQQRAMDASFQSGLVALEGAVDPSEYVVGPGDQFSITIGGIAPISQMTSISIDGNLALPDAGAISAAGRHLDVVRREALAALRQRYRNVPLEVSLMQPRLFYVHISGAVPEPGRYLMLPMSRVDDAVQQAYASRIIERPDPRSEGLPRIISSATSERPVLNAAYQPSLRNVRITHRDGTEQTLDLIRYYNTGDTKDNPYLLDGDVITVPPYHVSRESARVAGDVAYPGIFDLRPDDTILDLLMLAAGPAGVVPSAEVRLTRRTDGQSQSRLYDVKDLLDGTVPPMLVEPGDFINVLPQDIAEASIQGQVEYPGTYRIENDKTTLRELIEIAGGLKSDASLRAAFIERPTMQSFKESGAISDLDFFSRTFLQNSIKAEQLSVDIEAALGPGGEDIVLQNNDRIVFPRNDGLVFVTGNVPKPGYVAYVEGQNARYYTDQAGGQGPLTTAVYVFEDGSGQMHLGPETTVRSGDTVFIDREDIAESPEIAGLLINDEMSKRQTRIITTQTYITGITAMISIIATLKSFGLFD